MDQLKGVNTPLKDTDSIILMSLVRADRKLTKNENPKTVYWLENKLYLNITNQVLKLLFFLPQKF
jgi:hypothetical protein